MPLEPAILDELAATFAARERLVSVIEKKVLLQVVFAVELLNAFLCDRVRN